MQPYRISRAAFVAALATAACGSRASSEPSSTDTGFDAQVIFEGGAVFMCGDCRCDGRTSYCAKSSGGPPAAGNCDDALDGGLCTSAECVPYAPDCGTTPSCACIDSIVCSPSQKATACFEREGGVGFEIRCGSGYVTCVDASVD